MLSAEGALWPGCRRGDAMGNEGIAYTRVIVCLSMSTRNSKGSSTFVGRKTKARPGRRCPENAYLRGSITGEMEVFLFLFSLLWAVGQTMAKEGSGHSADVPPRVPGVEGVRPADAIEEVKPEIKASSDVQQPQGDDAVSLNTWTATPKGRFPWVVSILDAHRGHTCLGTLIHPEYVLSAAHCTTAVGANPIMLLGLSGEGTRVVRAKDAIIHPYWKGNEGDFQMAYDLVLFHLQESVDLESPVLAAHSSTYKQVHGSKNFLGFWLGQSLEMALFTTVENGRCPNLTVPAPCFCIYSHEALMVPGSSGGPVLEPGRSVFDIGTASADGKFPMLDLLVGVVSCNNRSVVDSISGVGVALLKTSRSWIDSVIKGPKATSPATVWLLAAFCMGIVFACVFFAARHQYRETRPPVVSTGRQHED
ncbi:unnamed protein product [Ostreobium quekettii]|uniref:Peptidase S1 domain-containing protein n=1 Tax=Ostreobium quekettii TaxID=121088 RepID=A0A8S1JBN8_9CHLO|nr:unnamed protein product [Ostreobium quekettii]|eukprot:evm.model.scf_806.2 EVM.evm.TU.scf_806.2   scf_806:10687-16103(-)